MKSIYFFLLVSFFVFQLMSCSDDDTIAIEERIELPVQGTYQWVFEIPGAGHQVSTHTFSNDNIAYSMQGDVYNVAYRMEVISYDVQMQKIIAIGEERSRKSGVYFAIFLKEITPHNLMLYKAELATEQEATNLEVPGDDNTDFHGWNMYTKEDH